MKKIVFVLAGMMLFLSGPACAEFYKVNVKRVDKDLYKDLDSGTFIKTRYCYEYSYGDEAILKWEGKYGDNKIIFKGPGGECEVKNLFK